MAAIEELIRSIADTRLRDALAVEVARLKAGKRFGLVFEEHLPETVLLPGLAIKVGARVMLKNDPHNLAFRVIEEVNGKKVKVIPDHVTKSGVIRGLPESIVNSAVVMNRADLVVAKAFGEPMYPALISVDAVERAPGKPWHVLINADNYHALQLLQYGYTGKVDVIYIDPPYNTGARDWKYNNDYVDGDDRFRHSKWLSMITKRLRLARGLLAPDGVLICAIDDYEVHHLICVLEELLPEYEIETVVVNHHPQGGGGVNISRTHEYAVFCVPPGRGLLGKPDSEEEAEWSLMRSGSSIKNFRRGFPNQFYAILVDPASKTVKGIEEPPERDSTYPAGKTKAGLLRVYPLDRQGRERIWRYAPETMRDKIKAGDVLLSKREDRVILKLRVDRKGKYGPVFSNWTGPSYNAGTHGTSLLNAMLGENDKFPYPKSIYTVAHCIATATRKKTNAVVLDFFGGSGTTLNAVCYLNETDNGSRRCVVVTNNEVNETAAKQLAGVEPGTPKWEAAGIAESVTWPRIKACIRGRRPDETEIPGEYHNGGALADGFDENAAYFKLDFLDPDEVSRGEQFEAVIPILWMLAGSIGACPSSKGTGKWFVPNGNRFAVLLKEDCFGGFREELAKRDDITHVFLVTDSAEAFNDMAAALGGNYTCLQLYRSYIDTFRINLDEPGTRGGSDFEPVPAFAEGGV